MNGTFVIPRRFRGPPDSGNGGYSCGLVASFIPDVAEVTLRRPPPLDRPLAVRRAGGSVIVQDGGEVVAQARSANLGLTVPEAPSYEAAEARSRRYAGFDEHPFPECFVCGPARAPGDGLRIFAGSLPGEVTVAAPWVPDPSVCDEEGIVRREILWSALDCPGYFAIGERVPALLGRMTAHVWGDVRRGERCVIAGWSLGSDGRKRHAATALFSESGGVVATCQQLWITPAVVQGATQPPAPS